ncbi:MAG: hypothetical protein IPO18_15615 [bacterium]|nr:hypothetical protein [bacterium]
MTTNRTKEPFGMRHFDKVLVANRGEIAVRVIQGLRELGIATVAVHSDPDRTALHALLADEAVAIGPAPAGESYLVGARLIEAARKTGAGAIHPGYGFLSENAAFCRAVEAAGLVFIGPTAASMEVMGDKLASRRRMMQSGVPVVPGTEDAVRDPAVAIECAGKIGYPVLLKASAGRRQGHARGAFGRRHGRGIAANHGRGRAVVRQRRHLRREVHRGPQAHRGAGAR